MDLIDTMNRIERTHRWHPLQPSPPRCPQCQEKFYDEWHVIPIPDTHDSRRVLISAKTRIQIHAWAYTVVSSDGTRELKCRPPKGPKGLAKIGPHGRMPKL